MGRFDLPRDVQTQINEGIEWYEEEQQAMRDALYGALNPDDDYDPDHEWMEMMEVSHKLQQKYDFLTGFMNKHRINVVREMEYDDSILDKSGQVTSDDFDSFGVKYYVVKFNGDIIEVPYKIIDNSTDVVLIRDTGYSGQTVGNYVEEDTRCILKHDYNNAGNNWSPLHVIKLPC